MTERCLQEGFDEYTPDVTAQIIRLDNEDKAKEVLEKAKASDADFAQLAKIIQQMRKLKRMVEKSLLILLQQKYQIKLRKQLLL